MVCLLKQASYASRIGMEEMKPAYEGSYDRFPHHSSRAHELLDVVQFNVGGNIIPSCVIGHSFLNDTVFALLQAIGRNSVEQIEQ
nr:hypothetical protein CFP56_11991 [Quercus suber]